MTRRKVPVISTEPLLSRGLVRDVRVSTVGHIPHKGDWVHHRFAMYAVGFVVRGRGTYAMGDRAPTPIGPGGMFVVFPGPVFHYGPEAGTEWEEYYVTILGPGVRRWLNNRWIWGDGSVRHLAQRDRVVGLFQELLDMQRRGSTGDADRAVVMTERLFVEAYYAQANLVEPRRSQALVERVRAYCDGHLAEPVDFGALAKSLGVSYSLLRREVRRSPGVGPFHYLTRVRCEKARHLLVYTGAPVKSIAAEVGIADPFTFSRTFKRCIGVSPQSYRDQVSLAGPF